MTEQYTTVSQEIKALIEEFNNGGREDMLCYPKTLTSFADLDQFYSETSKAGIRALCDLVREAVFEKDNRTILHVKSGVAVLLTVGTKRIMETEKETPQQLATRFHGHYETLAPEFGYETRLETRQFDPETPNGRLMIAVCGKILEEGL